MADYSPHQKKIIERYYDHRDDIMLARLQELVTELYLAGTERKIDRLWKRAATAIEALKVPPKLAEHILTTRDPEVLARNLKNWLEASKNSKHGRSGSARHQRSG